MTAHFAKRGPVAVITLYNPPMNGLGLATRQAFMQALRQAEQDADVHAIVINGAGKQFCSGADIKALCHDAQGNLLGYALTGTAVQEKLALNRQLPALLA